jgi:prephenate dehydrogenase
MHVQRLSILGVGLLGGSLGMAYRSVSNSCQIIGYGHRPETLDRAMQMGAVTETTRDLTEAVTGADLVILCTPVGLFGEILTGIAPALAPGTIVTDVGSTKRSVVRLAAELLPQGVHFVGSHPMAGSEKRGVEFARADLFQHALCIVTPTESTDRTATETVEQFWQKIGMRTTRLSPDDHDRLVAEVSHLPHALAAALVAMQSDEGLRLAGKGFLDATRIASGDGALWRDILLDNRDNVRAGVRRFQASLDELLKRLDDQDSVGLQAWLDAAARRRELWAQQKLRELNAD